MKYDLECKFCGRRDSINGASYARQVMYDHLEIKHPVEFEKWKVLRLEVKSLNSQIHEVKKQAINQFGLTILD